MRASGRIDALAAVTGNSRSLRNRGRSVREGIAAVPGGWKPATSGYSPDESRVAVAADYADRGEPVHLIPGGPGAPIEFWAQGARTAPEAVVAKEMRVLYGSAVDP